MIEQLDIDGVPTVYAHKNGPTAAGLTFRVGQADETLARRGITHLIEHLALHSLGLTDYHSNGATALTLTHFYLDGTETDVVRFIDSVCSSLERLPLDRLDRERDILETEQAGRSHPALPAWRYGAQGYGLPSYNEWGLERLGADEVLAWTRRWFTRENAVLWVAGERVPPGLRVALPAGERRPAPPATSALDVTPAWFASGRGEVVMDAVLRRSAAGSAYATVLGKELWKALRQDGGYSYTATAAYEPRDGRFATLRAYADAHPEKEDAVVGGFIEVLAAMRAGRIDESSVVAGRERALERFAQPDFDASRLTGYAGDMLLGAPAHTAEELRAEAEALTVADIHAAATEAYGTTLLLVPQGRSADWARFAAAPVSSREVVPGQAYPAIGEPGSDLVVGAEGVSVRTPNQLATVRFDHCAARLDWPDGRRVLIGLDGISVTVEPTLFALDEQGRTALDARLDPGLVIPRPPRAPDAIPTPTPPPAPGKRRKAQPGWSADQLATNEPLPEATVRAARARPAGYTRLHEVGLWAGLAVSAFFLLICVIATVASIQDPSAPDSDWGTTAVLWLFLAVPLWPTTVLWRRRRGRG